MKQTFQRSIQIQVETEGAQLTSRSVMEDEYHSLELQLQIELTTHQITECKTAMRKYPYELCPSSQAALAAAVGLKLSPVSKKDFRRAVVREQGCAHFTELFDNTVDYLLQKIYWDGVGFEGVSREEIEDKSFAFLNDSNTCRVFNRETQYKPRPHEFLPKVKPTEREDAP